ncbi:Hypothetical protein PBC10988_33490 [Planctomycetales bacterium 10988]|nr:Hypothetical protein PBC10988_33490 [Planctomycetales bacterium 10988]
MKKSLFAFLFVFVLGSCYTITGCTPPAAPESDHAEEDHDHDHDHDHHDPENFKELVAEIEELNGEIKSGFEGDDHEAAHDPLHELGEFLEMLPAMADESDLSEDQKEAVKKAGNQLMYQFGEVDAKMHGGPGKDYADIEEAISEPLKTLKEAADSLE